MIVIRNESNDGYDNKRGDDNDEDDTSSIHDDLSIILSIIMIATVNSNQESMGE